MAKSDCKLCNGTGWIVERRDGIPAAARCGCVAEAWMSALEERSQIPKNYRNASFDTFHFPEESPARDGLKKVVFDVRSYVRNYPKTPKPGLLIIGNTGTGKTHLA